MAIKAVCKIEGCSKPAAKGGWCSGHYQRWRRTGHPQPKAPRVAKGEPLAWLEANALTAAGDECLIYPFGRDPKGYGVVGVGGRKRKAHQWVCERLHGAAPTSKHQAAHSCGNGKAGCVSGGHLRWATPTENAADRVSHGGYDFVRGHAHRRSRLVEADVLAIRRMQGAVGASEVARRYDVTTGAIYAIWKRETWAWLTEVDESADRLHAPLGGK